MYLHGGDIYRNNVKYDFSVNVNPLGMPESVLSAGCKGVEMSGAYPDYDCEELKCAIEKNKGIRKEHIIAGNGAAELIYAFCRGLNVKKALVVVPAFDEYERAVRAGGGVCEYYRLKEEDAFAIREDIEEYIGNDTDAVFICNPNNPTGRLEKRSVIEKIIRSAAEKGAYVCVDECFMPFCQSEDKYTVTKEYEKYDNVIVLRAFTKIYAMAGLRLGYIASCNKSIIEAVRSQLQPWNVSLPAQMAGVAALCQHEYVKKTVSLIKDERKYLTEELEKGLAVKVYRSDANFILFKAERDIYDKFIEKGFLIRDCGNFKNLEKGYYRICVGTHSKNTEFIRAFREIIKEGKAH